ncbi:MAG: GtrA family protein [Desulfobacteraceae bacterium]|nr:GtrA family protein [Desulfobacteraceae bacterium]
MTTFLILVRKYQRVISFGLVGGFVALLGSALLFLFVDILHIEQNIAYFLQTVIALQINFNLNDLITWRDRRGSNGFYWERWLKYHIARLLTVIVCQLIFLSWFSSACTIWLHLPSILLLVW